MVNADMKICRFGEHELGQNQALTKYWLNTYTLDHSRQKLCMYSYTTEYDLQLKLNIAIILERYDKIWPAHTVCVSCGMYIVRW